MFIEVTYTQISRYNHICANIIFPLFYCGVKVGLSKQVLSDKTPLNQIMKILSIPSNSDTMNDEETEATRILGAFVKIGF